MCLHPLANSSDGKSQNRSRQENILGLVNEDDANPNPCAEGNFINVIL